MLIAIGLAGAAAVLLWSVLSKGRTARTPDAQPIPVRVTETPPQRRPGGPHD